MQASVESGQGALGEPSESAGDARRGDPGPLLARHAAGDADAFPELVAAYRRPVFSYLSRCGVDPEDRDDVFQHVFLRIHRAAGQYDPERPAHPWLFTIVANEVRRHLRRRRVRQLVFAEPSDREPEDPAPDSQRVVEVRETVAWLERELAGLPLPQREVLVLACIESRPLQEVAEALGRPLNTVKTHLRRARLALGRGLAHRRGHGAVEERS
jgi:RNA polymerase sigma-70 factor, ECF subfamily